MWLRVVAPATYIFILIASIARLASCFPVWLHDGRVQTKSPSRMCNYRSRQGSDATLATRERKRCQPVPTHQYEAIPGYSSRAVTDELRAQLLAITHPNTRRATPSVYDTAISLYLLTPNDGARAEKTLAWLREQQAADGGWGCRHDPPSTRTVPTLAALLALRQWGPVCKASGQAVVRGLRFLRLSGEGWDGDAPEPLPAAAPLTIPYLLELAHKDGLCVDDKPYKVVTAAGHRMRQFFQKGPIRTGTLPLHTWEAWGVTPKEEDVDALGSVGLSPSATAAWIAAARNDPALADAVKRAEQYLVAAEAAVADGVPGVLPTVYPLDHFELSLGLYALCLGGLLTQPSIHSVVAPQVEVLRRGLTPDGIGCSTVHFECDGDTTGLALAVLAAWDGAPVDVAPLFRYYAGDHYITYPGEESAALTTTIHAAHALLLSGGKLSDQVYDFILSQQGLDGLWDSDRWNYVWAYPTSQALLVLDPHRHAAHISRAVDALCRRQHHDGGWGVQGSSREETAYIILTLRYLIRRGHLSSSSNAKANDALDNAHAWMRQTYGQAGAKIDTPRCWRGKVPYTPTGAARLVELAATLTPNENLYID